MSRQLICAIVGRRVLDPLRDRDVPRLAMLAAITAVEAGYAVLTGGKEGVMQHAALAAKGNSGTTLAILPDMQHAAAVGDHYSLVLPTPLGIVRNALTASACDVMIALPGGSGTVEEVLFAQDFERPVVQFPEWLSINTIAVPACSDQTQLKEWLDAEHTRISKVSAPTESAP